ncbi:MAG: SPOR domain-containing protein [Kofleriaceae bacterium]
MVLRQDDNGNVFVVAECASEAAARGEARAFEARAHKQIYWIEPRGEQPPRLAGKRE